MRVPAPPAASTVLETPASATVIGTPAVVHQPPRTTFTTYSISDTLGGATARPTYCKLLGVRLPHTGWHTATIFLDDVELGTWFEVCVPTSPYVEIGVTCLVGTRVRIRNHGGHFATLAWAVVANFDPPHAWPTKCEFVSHVAGGKAGAGDNVLSLHVKETGPFDEVRFVNAPHWTGSPVVPIHAMDAGVLTFGELGTPECHLPGPVHITTTSGTMILTLRRSFQEKHPALPSVLSSDSEHESECAE